MARRSISEYLGDQVLPAPISPLQFQENYTPILNKMDQRFAAVDAIGAGMVKPLKVLDEFQDNVTSKLQGYQGKVDELSTATDSFQYKRAMNALGREYVEDITSGPLSQAIASTASHRAASTAFSEGIKDGSRIKADASLIFADQKNIADRLAKDPDDFSLNLRSLTGRENYNDFVDDAIKNIQSDQTARIKIFRDPVTGRLRGYDTETKESVSDDRAKSIIDQRLMSNANFRDVMSMDRELDTLGQYSGSGAGISNLSDSDLLAALENQSATIKDPNMKKQVDSYIADINSGKGDAVRNKLFAEQYTGQYSVPGANIAAFSKVDKSLKLDPNYNLNFGSGSKVVKPNTTTPTTLVTDSTYKVKKPYNDYDTMIEYKGKIEAQLKTDRALVNKYANTPDAQIPGEDLLALRNAEMHIKNNEEIIKDVEDHEEKMHVAGAAKKAEIMEEINKTYGSYDKMLLKAKELAKHPDANKVYSLALKGIRKIEELQSDLKASDTTDQDGYLEKAMLREVKPAWVVLDNKSQSHMTNTIKELAQGSQGGMSVYDAASGELLSLNEYTGGYDLAGDDSLWDNINWDKSEVTQVSSDQVGGNNLYKLVGTYTDSDGNPKNYTIPITPNDSNATQNLIRTTLRQNYTDLQTLRTDMNNAIQLGDLGLAAVNRSEMEATMKAININANMLANAKKDGSSYVQAVKQLNYGNTENIPLSIDPNNDGITDMTTTISKTYSGTTGRPAGVINISNPSLISALESNNMIIREGNSVKVGYKGISAMEYKLEPDGSLTVAYDPETQETMAGRFLDYGRQIIKLKSDRSKR